MVRIAVRPAGWVRGMPFNPRGIELRDGSFLPTYDWMPESVAANAEVWGGAIAENRTNENRGTSRIPKLRERDAVPLRMKGAQTGLSVLLER